MQVDVKSVESAWDVNTITWNTQPEISNKIIATTWNKGVDGRNHGVNITRRHAVFLLWYDSAGKQLYVY